jgi:hypothetical protein
MVACPEDLCADWRAGEAAVRHLLVRLYRLQQPLFSDLVFRCRGGRRVHAHRSAPS